MVTTAQLTFSDLEQRADRAAEYCYDAIAARDWPKFERALTRLIDRWAQWDALHQAELIDEFGPNGAAWRALQDAELFPRLQNREITAGDLLRAVGQADAPVAVVARVDMHWYDLVQRIQHGEAVPAAELAYACERIVIGYCTDAYHARFGDVTDSLPAERAITGPISAGVAQ